MSSLSDDPRLVALLDTTARITGPGMPFEIVEEDVLGERLPVFANRPRSMREILLGADRFGDRDCYVFGDGFRLAFDQLLPQVASLAGALRDQHGIGPGRRPSVEAVAGLADVDEIDAGGGLDVEDGVLQHGPLAAAGTVVIDRIANRRARVPTGVLAVAQLVEEAVRPPGGWDRRRLGRLGVEHRSRWPAGR